MAVDTSTVSKGSSQGVWQATINTHTKLDLSLLDLETNLSKTDDKLLIRLIDWLNAVIFCMLRAIGLSVLPIEDFLGSPSTLLRDRKGIISSNGSLCHMP